MARATGHPEVPDRKERGRSVRTIVPRSTLGAPAGDPSSRPDALATILAQSAARAPHLVALRHGRMAASPWTYFRGAAAVMANDLARAPHTGLTVQMCGDAHVLNYGLWATPERHLSFDLRDFDETLPGPFEWDVVRLVTSLVVAARHNGLPERTADDAVRAATTAYRSRMRGYATASNLDIWYDSIHVDDLLGYFGGRRRRRVGALVEEQRVRRTSVGAFRKLTEVVEGERRIIEKPPRLTHIDDPDRLHIAEEVLARYSSSLRDDHAHLLGTFRLVDVARQVVGVGSVGMLVFLVLLEGRDGDDPLFLQVKQAHPSVYERHLRPSAYANHGARVVNGKRLIQSATDVFAGWTSVRGNDFYVRQFRDMKIVPDAEQIAPALVEFAEACGSVLARAHARSGDAVAIAAYLGRSERVDDALLTSARAHADQNERDHAQLVAAIAAGEVDAEAG